MKLMKKLISLVMATIMITSAPVLQASDLANLNMAEIDELKQEIFTSIMDSDDFNEDGKIDEEIPSVKELQRRYKEALDNYEIRFKEFSKYATKQSIEDAKQYLKYKKHEAEILAKTDSTYNGFGSEEEKQSVAFFDLLYQDLERAEAREELREEWREYYIAEIVEKTFGGAFLGFLVGGIADLTGKVAFSMRNVLKFIGIGSIIGLVAGLVLTPVNRIPVFSSEVSTEVIKYKFLESPFSYLAILNDRGANNDFAILYRACPQVLYDVVDIDWYISRNPTAKNMAYRIYTRTKKWQGLSTEDRASYLHDYAERLRAEAQEIKNSQNAN